MDPEIVISIGGNVVFNLEIKSFLANVSCKFEHWSIGSDLQISDPFRALTISFRTSDEFWFDAVSHGAVRRSSGFYSSSWIRKSNSIPTPDVEYSELSVIGQFLATCPGNCFLQIANSYSIRMVHLFDFDKSIRCFCNRGVNGIDGCLSTAVGFASLTDKPVFLVIGDLAFYYDMNALWNKHVSSNLRILLLNNAGGSVLYATLVPDPTGRNFSSPTVSSCAEDWCRSAGFRYSSCGDGSSVSERMAEFVDISNPGPCLFEVFTDMKTDTMIYQDYLRSQKSIPHRSVIRKLGSAAKKLMK